MTQTVRDTAVLPTQQMLRINECRRLPVRAISGLTNHNYAASFGSTHYGQTTLNGVVFAAAPFSVAKSVTDRFVGIKLSEIVDGLSHTLMVAEVIQGRGSDLRGFTWWGMPRSVLRILPRIVCCRTESIHRRIAIISRIFISHAMFLVVQRRQCLHPEVFALAAYRSSFVTEPLGL